MTTRSIRLDWARLAGKPSTEKCRAFRHEASVTTGHVWSEHFDVEVDITVLEPRKPRQQRSKLDLRAIQTLALDAIIGPIVASPARVQAVHIKKRWATDNPGVVIVIRTYQPESESA